MIDYRIRDYCLPFGICDKCSDSDFKTDIVDYVHCANTLRLRLTKKVCFVLSAVHKKLLSCLMMQHLASRLICCCFGLFWGLVIPMTCHKYVIYSYPLPTKIVILCHGIYADKWSALLRRIMQKDGARWRFASLFSCTY